MTCNCGVERKNGEALVANRKFHLINAQLGGHNAEPPCLSEQRNRAPR